jgi:prepilin-type N-terminal cleavage/methylation domain-containing protein
VTLTSIRKPERRGDAGFTLIEVMIAIVLLVGVSVSIFQATTQTFKYRSRAVNEGDFYSGIRLAMGLIDRDTAALFSPVNMNPKNFPDPTSSAAPPADPTGGAYPTRAANPYAPPGATGGNAAQAQQLDELLKSDLGKTSDYWLAATDLTAIRPSRFIGTENRLQFVTSDHMRIYKNSEECEFSKVVYELRDAKDSELGDGVKTLVKIEDADVFDDGEKKGKSAKIYPLLQGVKRMSIRYFRKDKKTWEKAWDNDHDDMKGLYPDIVEVSIDVVGPAKLSYKGVYMFKPETAFYGMDSSF